VADLHLQKRGSTWHYYRRVPLHLVPIIGKSFIKKSLGTGDKSEARKLRNLQDVMSDAMFAAAEAALAAPDKSVHASLEMMTEYVRAKFAATDERYSKGLVAEPPVDQDDLKERLTTAEEELGFLLRPADPRRDEWIATSTDRIIAEVGGTPSDPDVMAGFVDVVRRGLIELQRRKIDRYTDRHDRPFHDNLFDPVRPATVTFDELAGMFVAERLAAYKVNGVAQKRADKIRANVAYLREVIGNGTPVHAIDDDVVQKLRTTLSRTPANCRKLYPNLPLAKAIEAAEKAGRPTIGSVTQSGYLETARDVLKLAVRKKLLSSNPAEDAKPILNDTLSAAEKRLPWTNDQIIGFFTGAFYQSCAPAAVEQYAKRDRTWRFWMPLLMLWTGARPNEIAQLEAQDLKRTEAGTWYLDLLDEGYEGKTKQLKTKGSRRRIPLHPQLLKLGLVAFMDERGKAQDGPRLFPSLGPDKYGNCAWYASKRLNTAFIPAEIELGPRQVLYSLRHNVRDALRRVKAPPETLRHVAGWSQGKTVSDDYGDAGNPDFHFEYVAGISYPGLDLSFLHCDAVKCGVDL
jgi:integrase